MYPALIQGGAAIAAAAIGRSKTPNANQQLKFETDRLRRLQKQFGISPLAALGTVGPMLSTQVGSDYGLADAGAAIAGQMNTDRDRNDRLELEKRQEALAMGQAELASQESVARREKDIAMADYYASLANATRTARATAPVDPSPSAQPGQFGGQVLIKPDQQVSARPGAPNVTAGTHAGFREHVMTKSGARLVFPYSEEGLHENMESMWAPWYAAAVINASKAQYGAKETARAIAELYGISEEAALLVVSPVQQSAEKLEQIGRGIRKYQAEHPYRGGASGQWKRPGASGGW